MMTVFESEAENFEMWMLDIRLKYLDDPEVCHQKMDELMCETLERFGCYSGVEIFRETVKCYA